MKPAQTNVETPISTRELASLFGLSSRRIRQLCEERVLPAPADGKFNLREAVSAFVTHLRARKDSKTLLAVRTRRTEAQARLAECEADLAEKQVVPVELVLKYNGGIFIGFKARVLASSLTPEEQHEILTDLQRLTVKDILNYAENENAAKHEPQQANQAHQ